MTSNEESDLYTVFKNLDIDKKLYLIRDDLMAGYEKIQGLQQANESVD